MSSGVITVTPEAGAYLQQVLIGMPGVSGIRIGVKKAGCSGYAYYLDAAKEITELDAVFKFEEHDVTVVVDEELLVKFLKGTQLALKTEGLNSEIVFNNPNASGTCGCGESFSVAT